MNSVVNDDLTQSDIQMVVRHPEVAQVKEEAGRIQCPHRVVGIKLISIEKHQKPYEINY